MTEKLRRKLIQLIHHGAYAAEVEVEIVYDENWVRTMSLDDARKLEAVRLALKHGDVAEAAKHGRVFELKPVAAE
jgi:hypothetical protein